ncbi:MAG: AAA family ATPase [Gemmataceae bacterium]|nr:AAA family ATPase [Gemmataceae bacterium]
MTDEQWQSLLFNCQGVFRPASPLDSRDLFSGRTEQIVRTGQAVHTIGQHAIIFGQRGVGKSSLANILKILLSGEKKIVVKVNCHKDDSFSKIWKNALDEIHFVEQKTVSVIGATRDIYSSPGDSLRDDAGVSEVKKALSVIGRQSDTVFIFDEFDRLHGLKVQQMFADLIKDLSDHAVNSTLILVGVANDVSGIIQEHASIDRCVVQIPMPRMNNEELKEIIQKAMQELGTTIEAEALELIVAISQGLPHYTHLIGRESVSNAIKAKRLNSKIDDVKAGVNTAVQNTKGTLLDTYQAATRGQRKGTLFQHVLLACALAEVDDQGFFISAAVRNPLTRIMKTVSSRNPTDSIKIDYDISGFSQHLDKFSSDPTRGPVLEKAGTARKFRFRFLNPLLQPYVIMRGVSDGFLDGELLELLRSKKQPEY